MGLDKIVDKYDKNMTNAKTIFPSHFWCKKGTLVFKTKCPLAQDMESFAFLPPLNSGARRMLEGGCKFGVLDIVADLISLLEAGIEKNAL